MRTLLLKGWWCFPPKDNMTIVFHEIIPCLKKRRKNCEIVGSCLGAMGREPEGKRWFKKCKHVELRVCKKGTILATSKIKFKD